MSVPTVKQLHWTQRIALARHNLHCASRSGDFTFFKSLQATGMLDGTNHFATLTAMLGDSADTVLASLDNLNHALAFVHEDAFQSVYENLKDSMRDENRNVDKSKLFVDISTQKCKIDIAIDKLSNSAVALINQQPAHVQDEAANVYITGLTLVADCIEVVTKQLDSIEQKMDDFIRLEESSSTVKASALAATAGLKGVFYMLDQCNSQDEVVPRSSSVSGASNMFRRISNAFAPAPSTRSYSIANAGNPRSPASAASPVYRSSSNVRGGGGSNSPRMRNTPAPQDRLSPTNVTDPQNLNFDARNFNFHHTTKLATIPPTPAQEDDKDPFDVTDAPPVAELPLAHHPMSTAVM